MARKRSIETINKELDRLENREKSLQTDIDSVKSEKEKLLSARNEILEMEQRKTVNKIARIFLPTNLRKLLSTFLRLMRSRNLLSPQTKKLNLFRQKITLPNLLKRRLAD